MTSLQAFVLKPKNVNLSVERKFTILFDIASGLEYLHSRIPAIIYQDLTARNVLLDSQQGTKIMEFDNA